MLFDVRTDHHGGWATVSVVGEVDLATVPGLRQHLRLVRSDHVVVNLDGVGFCDSLGLGVLIGAARRLKERGGRLVVLCPPGRVHDLLVETGVDRILEVTSVHPADGSVA